MVVAEGAKFVTKPKKEEPKSSLKPSLSPLATGEASEHVIQQSGQAAQTVATELQLLIAEETDLGFKAIVNNEHWGMLYKNQIYQPLSTGQKTTGYINKVRDDEKIDLLLEKPGYEKVDAISQKILDELKQNRGFMAVSDNTSPEMINAMFGISKKNFKKAIGNLYKKRMITFDSDGIRLVKNA